MKNYQKLFAKNSKTKTEKDTVIYTVEESILKNSKKEDTNYWLIKEKSNNSLQCKFNLNFNMLLKLFAYDEIQSFI